MSKGYIHFTWNDKDAFNELLNVVVAGLNENDYDGLKPFFTLFYHILLTSAKADKTELRFERAMNILMETMENNQQYYKFMEVVYEYLFKLAAALPQVAEWLKTNRDRFKWLILWA